MLQSTWNFLKGKKTYIALIVGAIDVGASAAGITPPGVTVDPEAYKSTLFQLAVAAAMRHGISTGA